MKNKVAMLIGLVAITACGSIHSGATADAIQWLPLAADLTPPPAPSPQSTPVPPGTPACAASQLVSGVIGSNGATGHVITTVAFAASGSLACYLDGTPVVSVLGSGGTNLGFPQRDPYMPDTIHGPVLVEPGSAPQGPPVGLKSGEAAFSLDWVSQPEACPGETASTIAAVRASIPGGGVITVTIPAEPPGYACQGVGVGNFEGPVIPTSEPPPPALPAISIEAPATARAGQAFRYVVTLTNDTKLSMDFAAACPNYEEELFTADGLPLGGKHIYRLNCGPAGTLSPGASKRFDMVLNVPADAVSGEYNLVFMLGFWNAMTRVTDGRPVKVSA